MQQVTVTLRVIKPWWMPLAVRLWIASLFVRGLFARREVTDADLKPFLDWMNGHIRVVAD